jgi:hypothetical protein
VIGTRVGLLALFVVLCLLVRHAWRRRAAAEAQAPPGGDGKVPVPAEGEGKPCA